MKNIAIILSGGVGTRLGSAIPKQYLKVNGRTILSYTMETIFSVSTISGVVVVAAEEYRNEIEIEARELGIIPEGKKLQFAVPGKNRQLSILSALLAQKKESADEVGKVVDKVDKVLIQDAARPLTSKKLIEEILSQQGCDGVLPVIPMKDTVYQSMDGKMISGLLDRSTIFAGQAPELFDFDKYLFANLNLIASKGSASDDSSNLLVSSPNPVSSKGSASDDSSNLLFTKDNCLTAPDDAPIYRINGSTEPAILAGMNIKMITGDENNFKITTKADLERFNEIILNKTDAK